MPSNYYAAPQYPQYAPATSGAGPVYASAAGSVAGAHSQHDVAGVKVPLMLLTLQQSLTQGGNRRSAKLVPRNSLMHVERCWFIAVCWLHVQRSYAPVQ